MVSRRDRRKSNVRWERSVSMRNDKIKNMVANVSRKWNVLFKVSRVRHCLV
jgi:hypothetical protein